MTGYPIPSTGASDDRLTIDRIDLRVAVAARPRDAHDLSLRVTRTVEDELPRACAEALGSLGDGDAVIRIKELALELAADADSVKSGALSGEWGRALAAAVRDAIAASRGVMRFDTPVDYLAAFLRDLADGSAWGRWYWDELRPLASARPGAATATLLSGRPGWILPVLDRLEAAGAAERVIGRLGAHDVRRIWAALGLPGTPALPEHGSPAWPAAERAWSRLRLELDAGTDARARNALRGWRALAAGARGERAGAAAVALVVALVELWALAQREPSARAVLRRGIPLDAIQRLCGADALGWMAPAVADGRLARAAEIVSDDRSPGIAPPAVPMSPFGSVVLIAPALAELGVWELWLDELGEDAARRNVFAVALKALGRGRAPLVLGDPVVALLAGLPGPPAADARLPVEAEPSLAWLDALTARVAPRELMLARLGDVHVLRDPVRAAWVAAWRPDGHPPGGALRGRSVRRAGEQELEEVAADAAHLQLGSRIGLPWLTPGLDAALSAVASLALRATARRIPGFGGSDPDHLARHFLAQPGSLERVGEELVAELGDAPLVGLLRMADLPESQPLPWAGASLRFELGSPAP